MLSINALYDNANTYVILAKSLSNFASSASSIFAIILFQDVYALHYAAHFLFNYLLFIYSVASLLSFLLITLDKRR